MVTLFLILLLLKHFIPLGVSVNVSSWLLSVLCFVYINVSCLYDAVYINLVCMMLSTLILSV